MPQQNDTQTRILEHGSIYFVYTPRIRRPGEPTKVEGIEEIERIYMILSSVPEGEEQRRCRRIAVGRKKLPDAKNSGDRFWGFVDIVSERPEVVKRELKQVEYGTATRGERVRPAARPAGEGVYCIAQHGNHNHLIYALELPEKLGPVQKELNIEPEASYVFSVKNPEVSSPQNIGLPRRGRLHYPEYLRTKFRGRQFIPAEPELLDYEGVEVLLIASSENPAAELGFELNPEPESKWSTDIFKDLQMEKSQHPVEPLLHGQCR